MPRWWLIFCCVIFVTARRKSWRRTHYPRSLPYDLSKIKNLRPSQIPPRFRFQPKPFPSKKIKSKLEIIKKFSRNSDPISFAENFSGSGEIIEKLKETENQVEILWKGGSSDYMNDYERQDFLDISLLGIGPAEELQFIRMRDM